MFDVKKILKGDLDAARLLNISDTGLTNALDRISDIEVSNIDQNIFTPYSLSSEVISAISDNAAKIGARDPLEVAGETIANSEAQFNNVSLTLPEFPVFENPLPVS